MMLSTYRSIIDSIRSNPLRVGLVIFGLALLLRLVFTWISLVNLPVTSDEASSVLLAKMISRGAFPLLFIGQPYQFPIESYFMAPLVDLVPRTPLGARYQQLILGFTAFLGFLAIVHTAFEKGSRWPAIALICFPSAYFLIYLAAYAPPQYSMSLTLAWVSIYAVLRSEKSKRGALLLILSGLCCGLAISNHLLTVTISAGVFALVLFSGSLLFSLKRIVIFSVSCLIGAIPYILAIALIPGAYDNLPNSVTLADALGRMINPALLETLPGAMGINPILFPDLKGHVLWPASLRKIFAFCYALLFLILTLQRLWVFITSMANRRWPKLQLVDLALITSLLSLWVFASHLTSASSYRYVLPAVWCFPFLVGYGFTLFTGQFRTSFGFITLLLTAFNIAVSMHVMTKWTDTQRLGQYALSPAIDELINTLDEKGITHCYASFWLAYRITFETDERIICSLPYNQRFPFWPIPYKDEVDTHPNAAYVLTQHFRPRLPVVAFERHLTTQAIEAEKTKIGPFFIYHDFRIPSYIPGTETVLTDRSITAATNGGNKQTLEALFDRENSSVWISERPQEEGLWIQFSFDTPKLINGITLFHLPDATLSPVSFKLLAGSLSDDRETWKTIYGPVESRRERLRFVHEHPVYNGLSQQLRFEPTLVKTLRIAIEKPNPENSWGVSEVEISSIDQETANLQP